MKRAEAERRRVALVAFRDALGRLLEVSDIRQPDPYGFDIGYEPWVMPKPGMQAEWMRRRDDVDMVAPKAALAFQATGVGLAWKPPGYAPGTSFPVNPASEWATVLSDSPKFGLDLLRQITTQALGMLDALVEEDQHRRARRPMAVVPRTWRGISAVGKWAISVGTLVVAGVLVGYLLFHFGWVGSSTTPQPSVPTTTTTTTTATPTHT